MFLKALSDARGISGQEDAVRDLIWTEIQPHADDVQVDTMGNLLARKAGTAPTAPTVMLAAHMDEVGMMVTGYDTDGLLRFTIVGSIDDRILPGLRVLVGKNALPGVITWVPIHKNREQNVVKFSSLRIDIGASSKGDAEGKAPRGTMIVFDTEFGDLGVLWRGKALDDRAGCAMLVDVLAGGPYPVKVAAAFTVQEEVGLRGAQVATRTLAPDVAFVLETTTAHDLPDPKADPDEPHLTPNPTCVVGNGPVFTVMDRSLMVSPLLLDLMRKIATEHDIPYQLKTRRGGSTDGGVIQTSNAGVPTATISLPARYIHSPAALLHPTDYEQTVQLVKLLLQTIQRDDYVQV